MILSITWKKIKDFCLKYWQIFVGVFIAVGIAIRFWFISRAQKRILKNAIESEKKIKEAEDKHDKAVKVVEEQAKKEHAARLEEIRIKSEEEKKIAIEELEKRTNSNRNASNEELANRLGDTFGVNVVVPNNSNASHSHASPDETPSPNTSENEDEE